MIPDQHLCLIVARRHSAQGPQVLLGRKQRGFGNGRMVVPGGKIDGGETPAQAAARELVEETSLVSRADDMRELGVITFVFPHKDNFTIRAHAFETITWQGDAVDSDEIAVAWASESALPFDAMWADAAHWLPLALADDLGTPTFWYGADNVTLERWER